MKTAISILLGIGVAFTSSTFGAPVLWSGNGHYYDFVPGSVTWQTAQTGAAGTTYLGMQGYLATVTSAAENTFLNSTYNNGLASQFAWLGGREPLDDGVWRWVTGPEAGIQFSLFTTATAPFNYANWGGIEPNDAKPLEDYLMMNIGQMLSVIPPGTWADAAPTPTFLDPVVGYLVEFSPVPEPTTVSLFTIASFLLWNSRQKMNRIFRS